ncbi:MAG: tRNA (guanosine(46)-N7)-methyltransferase TrmB [Bacteroidales bacterium]|nr:tRNA (guanosine(46)-N7)-methyltransferase TrmB [Bacteroidales bacterium]
MKNKLAKWAEMDTFTNVIQPLTINEPGKDHPLKGNWNKEIFRNNNPITLELGCGKGEYTISLSMKYPGNNYIGIDIKGARMWRGAKTALEKNLSNVAFLRTRIEFINSFFSENEINEVWLTFPDPHPGKRNSNKRLTCPWFMNKYRGFMKDNGVIHLKTDNTELFNYTKSLALRNELQIINSYTDLHSSETGDDILYVQTHYENIFLKEGMKINYLSFRIQKDRLIE